MAKEGSTVSGLMDSFATTGRSRSSTACRCAISSTSSPMSGSSRRGSRATRRSRSRSRSSTTSSDGSARGSSRPMTRRRSGSSTGRRSCRSPPPLRLAAAPSATAKRLTPLCLTRSGRPSRSGGRCGSAPATDKRPMQPQGFYSSRGAAAGRVIYRAAGYEDRRNGRFRRRGAGELLLLTRALVGTERHRENGNGNGHAKNGDGKTRLDHHAVAGHDERSVQDPGRRPQLRRVRLDHGPQRQLLQVPELRLHERLQLRLMLIGLRTTRRRMGTKPSSSLFHRRSSSRVAAG